jgi:hypothetical protein
VSLQRISSEEEEGAGGLSYRDLLPHSGKSLLARRLMLAEDAGGEPVEVEYIPQAEDRERSAEHASRRPFIK